jgi:sortase A
VGWTLLWSGLLIFVYLGWQLLGTDLLNARAQAVAEVDLGLALEEVRQDLPVVEKFEVPEPETEGEGEVVVEYHPEEAPVETEEFAQMRVPRLNLSVVVFEGVSAPTLSLGPGHMPGTPLPGQPGNAVISGHRTTYGRPFFDLDLLGPGDRIEIETAIGLHVYEVRESFVVKPTDVWVTDDRPGGWLTLTTCEPKFSARERLIISAELVEGPNADYVNLLEGRLDDLA